MEAISLFLDTQTRAILISRRLKICLGYELAKIGSRDPIYLHVPLIAHLGVCLLNFVTYSFILVVNEFSSLLNFLDSTLQLPLTHFSKLFIFVNLIFFGPFVDAITVFV